MTLECAHAGGDQPGTKFSLVYSAMKKIRIM